MLKKWLVVVSIPLVFQVVFLVILFRSQADLSYAQDWTIHTVDVIAQAETISRLLNEAKADVLGRLVAGDESMVRLDKRRGEIDGLFVTVSGSVKDNAKQVPMIEDVAARSGRYLDWLAEIDRLDRAGRREEAVASFRSPGRHETLAALRKRIDVFLGRERKLDSMRRVNLDRVARLQSGVLLGGSALTAFLALAMVMAFSRGFARRVDTLTQNARSLAEGKALAAPLQGKDEIAQLDGVFHAMARALAERDQENEMFIYSVSHDLRSPLVNLQGFSKELSYTGDDLREAIAKLEKPPEAEARFKRLLDEDMPSSIHFIQNAVNRLSAIIDSLLRLSRAGRVEYRIEEIDVGPVVHRVVEALESSTKEKGAKIRVGPLPPAWGDATVIEQVFANLLSNAVKYLDPARPGTIEVGASGDRGDLTTYYVKDNGLGIPKGHQMKLFHAFQRLHPGTASGEGIGLALVRRMVERHGGKIWAESEDGVGSTFYVTLPSHAPGVPLQGRPKPVLST